VLNIQVFCCSCVLSCLGALFQYIFAIIPLASSSVISQFCIWFNILNFPCLLIFGSFIYVSNMLLSEALAVGIKEIHQFDCVVCTGFCTILAGELGV
jgi:hypothetical protein